MISSHFNFQCILVIFRYIWWSLRIRVTHEGLNKYAGKVSSQMNISICIYTFFLLCITEFNKIAILSYCNIRCVEFNWTYLRYFQISSFFFTLCYSLHFGLEVKSKIAKWQIVVEHSCIYSFSSKLNNSPISSSDECPSLEYWTRCTVSFWSCTS